METATAPILKGFLKKVKHTDGELALLAQLVPAGYDEDGASITALVHTVRLFTSALPLDHKALKNRNQVFCLLLNLQHLPNAGHTGGPQ